MAGNGDNMYNMEDNQKESKRGHQEIQPRKKEKYKEYNIPVCIAFVDYKKAFDCANTPHEL